MEISRDLEISRVLNFLQPLEFSRGPGNFQVLGISRPPGKFQDPGNFQAPWKNPGGSLSPVRHAVRQCQHQRHYQQYLRYCLFYNFHKVRRWRPLGRVVDVANFLLKMNSTDRQKDKDNAANMIVRTDNWSKSEPALTRSLIEEVLLLFHIVFRPVGLMYKIFQRWLLR